MTASCPFCNIDTNRILLEDKYSFCIYDTFPISKGHTLIIPKIHIQSFFELKSEHKQSMVNFLDLVKEKISKDFKPDAFNIGINDGVEAGQTIDHLHIHLIPRYKGDQKDPRGGIRLIFPEKAQYWDD